MLHHQNIFTTVVIIICDWIRTSIHVHYSIYNLFYHHLLLMKYARDAITSYEIHPRNFQKEVFKGGDIRRHRIRDHRSGRHTLNQLSYTNAFLFLIYNIYQSLIDDEVLHHQNIFTTAVTAWL